MVLKPIPAWKWIAAAILCLALVASSLLFVRWTRSQARSAQAAVTILHQRMTLGFDSAIFSEADPTYRDTITADTSNTMFANVRTHLGAPRSSIQTDSDDSTDETMGSFLTLHYTNAFDKGSGNETICLHNVNGTWKLAAYNVESPLLRPAHRPVPVSVAP